MAVTVLLRQATAPDLEQILAIEAAWPMTPKWTRGHFEHELASPRSYFCVAEVDGVVLGYGALLLVPPEAQVTTVAVQPDRARKGLGQALMEHLHDHAMQAECSTMTLEVSAANGPALRLYRRLGYQRVGRRPKYYRDGSDALLMTGSSARSLKP